MSTLKDDIRGIRRALNLLVAVVLVACLYFGRDFFLPVTLAILFTVVLRPVSRAMSRRGVPTLLGAAVIVLGLNGIIGAAFYFAAEPAQKWMEEAPRISQQLQFKFKNLMDSANAVSKVNEQLEDIAQPGIEDRATEVVVKEPGLLSQAASGGVDVLAGVLLCGVLLYFLLATADVVLERFSQSLPNIGDKLRALQIAREIEREVSRYLLTVTLINIGLGLSIAFAMWQVSLPNPLLWGAMATMLNFIPYVGAIAGSAVMLAISAVTFGTPVDVIVPPLLYLGLTAIEGQLITPMILGRRLNLNPAAVFLSVAFWGWLWGVAGAVAAVPILLILKIVADRVDGMPVTRALLSAKRERDAASGESEASGATK